MYVSLCDKLKNHERRRNISKDQNRLAGRKLAEYAARKLNVVLGQDEGADGVRSFEALADQLIQMVLGDDDRRSGRGGRLLGARMVVPGGKRWHQAADGACRRCGAAAKPGRRSGRRWWINRCLPDDGSLIRVVARKPRWR